MADQSPPPRRDLAADLETLQSGLGQLEGVLNTLFEMFAASGIKPTFHLNKALTTLRQGAQATQDSGQHVMQQIEQLHELVRISALITSSLELDAVLEEVLDTVIQLTDAERAYLMLYDDFSKLQIRAARNWDRQTISENDSLFSQSIVNAAIEDGVPIITTNAQADERFQSKASIVIQQLRSIICLPLTLGGKTVGVLYMDNRFQQALFEQDLAPLLTAFGTQAAIAITNARIFGAVRSDLAEAEAEINRLRIEVDRQKLDTQVGEITGTDYFQRLSESAKAMREKRDSGTWPGAKKAADQGKGDAKKKKK